MPLIPGARVGSYEITASIGAGGMGEVYRARDSKLKRDVAIKVLPADVANDPERLARFQREAEVLASLNHPNIAHVYGIEDGALVMELVEGEDLSQRIARGPIPIDEALPIAKQIAEALEAAHDAGIIHRDLKPANVKVRDDETVKVLDFGLAKALAPPQDLRSSGPQDLANSPTITSPAMTVRGMILGTAAYMSPEQAKGKPVDKRADIWAFGCVLYEMLTGRHAFAGDDITDTLTAIMRDEPDWLALQHHTPEAVHRVLRRCLQKDARRRLRDIGDTLPDLDPAERLPGRPQPRVLTAPTALVVATSVALGGLLALLAITLWPNRTQPEPVSRVALMPPIDAPLLSDSGVSNLAITPDGRRIFYTARRLDPDGVRITAGQLVSRDLSAFETTPLPNTGMRPTGPFTSPDGAWVAFETATGAQVTPVLAKVPATGGSMVVLCDLGPRGALRGASWTGDGRIVFATSQIATGLQMVPDTGGSPTILTTPDAAKGERDHRWPAVLPGGKGMLFGILRDDNTMDIAVLAAGEPALRVLIRGAGAPRYLADGYIVYATGGTLYGVRFDLQSLTVSGEPVALVDGVQTATAGVAEFAVAANGTLAYLPGGERRSRLVWLHRDGAITALPLDARTYQSARLSPDGRRIAVVMTERGTPNIWIYDLGRDTFTRVTPRDEMVDAVVWSPDSSRLAFWSDAKKSIFTVAVDGGDRSDALVSVDSGKLYPNAWTPDGRSIVFIREMPRLGLFTVPFAPPREVRPFVVASGAQVEAGFSPDGRWVTHAVFDGGRPEVVVGPADVPDRRWQVATAGRQPRWSKDGREVLFIEGGAIYSVPIDSRTGMASGRARKTLDLPPRMANIRPLELAPDGRFLMLEHLDDEHAAGEIRLVLNWFDELRTKLRPRQP